MIHTRHLPSMLKSKDKKEQNGVFCHKKKVQNRPSSCSGAILVFDVKERHLVENLCVLVNFGPGGRVHAAPLLHSTTSFFW